MPRPYEIEITGYLVGPIWWPVGAECWKEFTYNVTREDARMLGGRAPLRHHVCSITGDGDFQGCDIADAVLTVTRRDGGRVVRRSWPLEHFPSVADMVRTDWDGPVCCDDFEEA